MEDRLDLTFETAMQQLEEIVRALESGELPLATSIEKYEASMKLVQFCREQLDKAEFQLEQLSFEGETNKSVSSENQPGE